MRARFINEKFKEDSDPIWDMGIGLIKKIKDWLELENLSQYEIDKETGSIDLYMSLYRNGSYQKNWEIPDYINFNYIKGSLEIINCKQIKSLRGFPKEVDGNVRIYQNGKRFSEKEVREAIPYISGELEVLSNQQKAQKLYHQRGPVSSRTSHELKPTEPYQRLGREKKQYSKGYNLYKTLQFIDEAGDKGRTRREILKFRYELVYGPGSYEGNTYYSQYYRRQFDVNRGWGSDLFKNASYFTASGIIRKLAYQLPDKRWVLNDEGKKRLEEYKVMFEKGIK